MIFGPHPLPHCRLPGGCEVKQPPTTSDGSQGSNVSDHIDPEIPIMEMELGCTGGLESPTEWLGRNKGDTNTNNVSASSACVCSLAPTTKGSLNFHYWGGPDGGPYTEATQTTKILMFEGECGETLYIQFEIAWEESTGWQKHLGSCLISRWDGAEIVVSLDVWTSDKYPHDPTCTVACTSIYANGDWACFNHSLIDGWQPGWCLIATTMGYIYICNWKWNSLPLDDCPMSLHFKIKKQQKIVAMLWTHPRYKWPVWFVLPSFCTSYILQFKSQPLWWVAGWVNQPFFWLIVDSPQHPTTSHNIPQHPTTSHNEKTLGDKSHLVGYWFLVLPHYTDPTRLIYRGLAVIAAKTHFAL